MLNNLVAILTLLAAVAAGAMWVQKTNDAIADL